jgi:5-methylcytosine-specific restriction endonuclease McrA
MGPVDAARLWRTPAFRALQAASSLEVNHRVPRRGGGYHAGCHHHLDGLETLCHRCHVAETNAQHQAARSGQPMAS